MRVGFVEGVLAVMVFMLLFNVCSLVLMIYWDIVRWFRVLTFTGDVWIEWGRICLGCWGFMFGLRFHMPNIPVSSSPFLTTFGCSFPFSLV